MPAFQTTTDVLTITPPPVKTEAVSFRLLCDEAQVYRFVAEWQQLWQSSNAPEPMRSPAWLMAWWRHYGKPAGWALRVGVFYSEGQLVAVAPMCARRIWYRPGVPMMRLTLLGADIDGRDGVCSEYLDITMRAGWEDLGLRQFTRAVLAGDFGSWHEMILPALDGANTSVARYTELFTSAGLNVTCHTVTEAPYLALTAGWDEYLTSLPKKRRYNITSALRDFEKWATGDWRLHRVENLADLADGARILRELHNTRWQDGEQSRGAFHSPKFQAFHDELMRDFLADGNLDLYWLSVHGEPIAAQYQFHANNKTYFYQCGRKTDVPERIRIGIVLNAMLLQKAFARGDREFDFLGGPAHYKLRFTETTRPIVELRIVRPGVREWLRHQGEILVNVARRVRNALRPKPMKPVGNPEPGVNID